MVTTDPDGSGGITQARCTGARRGPRGSFLLRRNGDPSAIGSVPCVGPRFSAPVSALQVAPEVWDGECDLPALCRVDQALSDQGRAGRREASRLSSHPPRHLAERLPSLAQTRQSAAELKLRGSRPPHPEPEELLIELLGDIGGRHSDRRLVDLLVCSRVPGCLPPLLQEVGVTAALGEDRLDRLGGVVDAELGGRQP